MAVLPDPELFAHCYRLLGSVHDADAVLREIPAGGDRELLYGLATTACLTRLERYPRRPLPTDLGDADEEPEGLLAQRPEVLWLEPVPDSRVGPGRDAIGLDLVAALQRLEPRERAGRVLRDFEGWPAAEIARVVGPIGDLGPVFDPGQRSIDIGPAQQNLLDRYASAFERYDVGAIVELFTDDAVWEMPPFTSWFRGAKNIGRLIATHCPAKAPGDQVLVRVEANGQPGFAVYLRDPVEQVHRAFQIQVLTLTAVGIVHAVAFFDLSLFETFGLPELLTGLPDSATLRPSQPTVELRRSGDDE